MLERCGIQLSNLALTLPDDHLETMSSDSSAGSRDLSVDCLKVCFGGAFQSPYLTDQQNYDIGKQLEDGVSPEIYLATCKRGRLKRRTVVLKKVLYLVNFYSCQRQHTVPQLRSGYRDLEDSGFSCGAPDVMSPDHLVPVFYPSGHRLGL